MLAEHAAASTLRRDEKNTPYPMCEENEAVGALSMTIASLITAEKVTQLTQRLTQLTQNPW
jgi:hypothetical protein